VKRLLQHVVSYLVLALMPGPLIAQAEGQAEYVWSVVPQFTSLEIHRNWSPLLEQIAVKTGITISLRTYDTIGDFNVALKKGIPDFVYLSPYHAIIANQGKGYMPIIRDGDRLLRGILVVRQDSTFQSLNDLHGKLIAFPSPTAFAASLYLRALLTEQEKIKFTTEYAGTHTNSYRMVLLGMSAASGGVEHTLQKQNPAAIENLRILFKTPPTPSHPISVHPRVPSLVREKVQQAIIEMSQSDAGKELLSAVLLSRPVTTNYEQDYQPLRALQLEKYLESGQ
jgi:phosphonate transport system substrate-binding protein